MASRYYYNELEKLAADYDNKLIAVTSCIETLRDEVKENCNA